MSYFHRTSSRRGYRRRGYTRYEPLTGGRFFKRRYRSTKSASRARRSYLKKYPNQSSWADSDSAAIYHRNWMNGEYGANCPYGES